jgi:hypothetical protein
MPTPTPTPTPTLTDRSPLSAPFVGQVYGSYIDPEFNSATSQVVFQDMQNRIWIGDIDPENGLFKTTTGSDYLVDENITIIFDRPPLGRKFSTNGPEWTKDNSGYCVVYTKQDKAGIMQQCLARVLNGKSFVTQLTNHSVDCYGNMPSRFEDGKPPRIAFTYNWPIWNAEAAWIFADKPEELHILEEFDYNRMSMWSAVSAEFLFVYHPEGTTFGQIARSNADADLVQVLTNDEGDKDDPGLFISPEFEGETLLVVNINHSAIGIYRDLKSPDGFWRRVTTLALPAYSPYKYISSVETIASATGVDGVSYFALLARESADRNSPGGIWVLGLGTDPTNRFARRVDDGIQTGEIAVRMEPEPFVGKNEIFVYYNFFSLVGGQSGLRRASTGMKVTANSTSPEETGYLSWQISYSAGVTDSQGNYLGGTEIMDIVAHKGKLYASISMWMDTPSLNGSDNEPKKGCQLLVKDSPDSPWRLEHQFPVTNLRLTSLESFTFTKDGVGSLLSEPVTILMCAPTTIGNVSIYSRDDISGRWTEMVVGFSYKYTDVRSMGLHRDKFTGMERVFMASKETGVISGVYDATLPGKIRWDETPELTGLQGRPMAFCECNGSLYMAAKPAVYLRIDGEKPHWETIYSYHTPAGDAASGMRGLTSVPNPEGSGEVLLMTLEGDADQILYLDPSNNHAPTVELSIIDYLSKQLGTSKQGGAIAAYNDMCWVKNPNTGEKVLLVGLAAFLRNANGTGSTIFTGYFIRYLDGSYELEQIPPIPEPKRSNPELCGTRTIAISPFSLDNDQVVYAGGYDAAGKPAHNTAWIYQASLQDVLKPNKPSPIPTPKPALTTDINDDGIVNILDITIVASLFGTTQGEPLYNEAADLDKNGQVNIIDMSMVAKDFGRTV